MIQTFRDDATQALFNGENTKKVRKAFPQELWSVMKRRLDAINAAGRLEDLASVSGNRFEELKYTMPGYYSIRVNDRFRVTFQYKDGNAFNVAIEDYHD